jgi:hypothetical protein
VNLPRLRYVAEGHTLLLVQTRAILDLEREERVERAALALRAFAENVCPERQAEGRAVFVACATELAAAKRNLARPAAIPVTLAVVNLPEPRCWPNALPGGTSPRRATRIEWAIKYAQWDDAAEDAWFIQRYAG